MCWPIAQTMWRRLAHSLAVAARYRAGGITPAAVLAAQDLPPAGSTAFPASTSFVTMDRFGNAVACALTMDNLFGTGRILPSLGFLAAASPAAVPPPLLSAGLGLERQLQGIPGRRSRFRTGRRAVGGGGRSDERPQTGRPMSVPVPDPGRANVIACGSICRGRTANAAGQTIRANPAWRSAPTDRALDHSADNQSRSGWLRRVPHLRQERSAAPPVGPAVSSATPRSARWAAAPTQGALPIIVSNLPRPKFGACANAPASRNPVSSPSTELEQGDAMRFMARRIHWQDRLSEHAAWDWNGNGAEDRQGRLGAALSRDGRHRRSQCPSGRAAPRRTPCHPHGGRPARHRRPRRRSRRCAGRPAFRPSAWATPKLSACAHCAERIAAHARDWYGLDLPIERIAVTVGASGAFPLAFLAAFNPGDRIAMAAPFYPPYVNILTALGMIPVILEAGPRPASSPMSPCWSARPADLTA